MKKIFLILFVLVLLIAYITNPTVGDFEHFIERQMLPELEREGFWEWFFRQITQFALMEVTYRHDYKLFSIYNIDLPYTEDIKLLGLFGTFIPLTGQEERLIGYNVDDAPKNDNIIIHEPFTFLSESPKYVKALEPFQIHFSIINNSKIPIVATRIELIEAAVISRILLEPWQDFYEGSLFSNPSINIDNLYIAKDYMIDESIHIVINEPGTHQFRLMPIVKAGNWISINEYIFTVIVQDTEQARVLRNNQANLETVKKQLAHIDNEIKTKESRIWYLSDEIDFENNQIEWYQDQIKWYQSLMIEWEQRLIEWYQDLLKWYQEDVDRYNEEVIMYNEEVIRYNEDLTKNNEKIAGYNKNIQSSHSRINEMHDEISMLHHKIEELIILENESIRHKGELESAIKAAINGN